MERRAVAAALCEPRFLLDRTYTGKVITILDRVTASIFQEEDRKSADFKRLRKGLGYGWSVAVAALPELGRCRMEKWITSGDRDIRWVMA